MNEEFSFSLLKLKEFPDKEIESLGSRVEETVYKKIINRRFNGALQKMEPFGFHYMISYPKEVTLSQLTELITVAMSNFVEPGTKGSPYTIKINEANKGKCLFC